MKKNEARNQSLLQLTQRGNSSNVDGDGEDQDVRQHTGNGNGPQSIITQVTSREASAKAPQALPQHGAHDKGGWRSRMRSLLCCFVPTAGSQYYRGEPETVLIRPPAAPNAPPHEGRAVLGPISANDRGKKTLVLDLDETLVHSSFKPIANPDFIIPVEIEGKIVDVYVLKRPYMDAFMETVGPAFETVVFTASLSKYADPLLDLLDTGRVVRWRLFRESCCPYEGNYVKNLLCLGRDLADTIIVDNSPHSYVFQPDNALPIGTFIDDPDDNELLQILPVLQAVEKVDDVRQHLGHQIARLHSQNARRSRY